MNDRRTGILALIGLLILVGLNVAYKTQPDPQKVDDTTEEVLAQTQWVGRLAPDFELPLMDGTKVSLADRIGHQIIVLNFWTTWCPPCRAEMPELTRFMARHGNSPILLLGIDVAENQDTVATFLKANPLPYPIGIDQRSTIQIAYGISSYPTTVVIGPDGRILLYETSAIMNADVALDPTISAALKKLQAGPNISKADYLAKLKLEPPPRRKRSEEEKENPLEGRALRIANTMPCPCGCSDTVSACGCATAKKIKAKLKANQFGNKTDAEIMTSLNKEFCMKGMGS